MTFIDEKIRMTCGNLNGCITAEQKSVPNVRFVPCGYKTSNTPPDDTADWKPYLGEEINAPVDSHFWFTFPLTVPEKKDGFEYRLCAFTGREGQWDASNPQFTVFIDSDTAYQAFDTNHTFTPVEPGEHQVNLYFYNGMNPGPVKLRFALTTVNLAVEKLWYDLSVPYQAIKCLDKNSFEYTKIINILDQTCNLLDFRKKNSPAFFESVAEASAFIQEELYDKLTRAEKPELAMIGHTHIDVAWLWTLAQTREKAQRSFATVIRLMEKYPDYVFMSSQPQLYQYVRESDPALYEKIKARVAEGRWETEGAMWLESDTNLVSGESLIRQILYGKKFMKDEFGSDNRILWLPDVFGYSAALPQILKRSGVPQFFTTKISWCETDTFPHDNFVWQGVDGSEIFAVLSDSYVKNLKPDMVKSSWNRHVDKKYSDVHVCTFGFGDGGGGPTPEMLENYARLRNGLPGFPALSMRKAGETINEIERQFNENAKKLRFLPKWSGELYLEMHRGTYTSMARNKKYNRQSEFLYQNAETVSVLSALYTNDEAYPKDVFDRNWRTILKNQFHDIIPGSSIRQVYEVSKDEYEALLAEGKEIVADKLARIAAQVGSDGGLFVYNPAPFAADALITTENGPVRVTGVPAHGWKVVRADRMPGSCSAGGQVIENDLVRVTFNEKFHIISIFDKTEKRELIPDGAEANVLEVYEDYPRSYDAWEITEYYKQKMWIAGEFTSVEPLNEGVRAGFVVTRPWGDSTITQTITLREGSARLDFATKVDWHEDHVLLRAAFPFDLRASHANYEIQFGHIERPTHRNTSWDEAKFEVSAHKWADLSEANYGVSILNDCKYGYSTDENVMRISLLKAATYPNPEADRGLNEFTYAVLPHTGPVGAKTIREAYLLNEPLIVLPAAKQEGVLPSESAPVVSSNEAFVVETIKRSEDGKDLILRGYESLGGHSVTELSFGFRVKSASLCDLMENAEGSAAVSEDGTSLTLSVRPFEIVTLRLSL